MSNQPIRTTIMVPLTYYVCNNPDHRHKSAKVAADCIERHQCAPRRITQKNTKKRYILCAKMWACGASFREAGERSGLERTYARKIVNRVLELSRKPGLEQPPEPDNGIIDGTVNPEHSAHYLARIVAVAEYWKVADISITVIYGPPGSGKTTNAEAFMKYYGCARLVDDWLGNTELQPGDLALTNVNPPFDVPRARFIGIKTAIRKACAERASSSPPKGAENTRETAADLRAFKQTALRVMDYMMKCEEPIAFLDAWMHGDYPTLANEWPDFGIVKTR